ncbi:hypothetical protein [Comamonas sp. 4034]|uniref:hypothetical protein n=1 Tax=Comamonas sp. 4034 TaxID=3156455 RepID=UPI003D1E8C9F
MTVLIPARDTIKSMGDAANSAAKAVSDAASSIGEGAEWAAQFAENYLVATVAGGVATFIKRFPLAEPCVDYLLAPKGTQDRDGQYMGQGCPTSSSTPPEEGAKPRGCANSGKVFPKIIYTNGINTPPEAACATMHKIADSRCAEVIGVYNATDGIGGDVANANRKINGDSSDKAAQSLSQLVQDMSARGEKVTIFAHSEGGLNAQTGLGIAYEKMEKEHGKGYANRAMQNMSVYSFGTAQRGWPTGPTYTQFTNFSDPVPHLIGADQRNTNRPFGMAPNTTSNVFANPQWNPIEAHSMDGTYLDYLNRKYPVPKGPNGSCC